ncbi:MAG TPA: trehalose-6-phosphate synthase [Candidatus Acidoferrales bacterium]|nr:trehalose-6-phosphate synthase [Candidatus Acidoferrales bacterium]
MKLTLKLVVSLVVGIAAVAFLFAYLQVRGVARALQQQMQREVARTADNLGEALRPSLESGSRAELERLALRYETRDHLAGVAVYDTDGRILAKTVRTDEDLARRAIVQTATAPPRDGLGAFFNVRGRLLAYVLPVERDGKLLGRLLVEYDTTPFRGQGEHQWRDTFLRALGQVALIAVVILLIIRWSILSPMARTTQWLREVRRGNLLRKPRPKAGDALGPLEQEVTNLVRSLETARAAAKQEAQLRVAGESLWTAERLRAHIRGKLQQNPLIVVSNREPYMHVRRGSAVEVSVPASGLVTALEPILCACNGRWIAHGSGNADRETVDSRDSLRVPPDQPEYTLRRVWLTKEEEEGYYYGFANEGIWPLCHIAHTRPLFRARDWACYQAANSKFARAVLEEMAGVDEPIVLVQDYHFALLPRMIKEARPDARVAIFWHIPWPNPEAVRICPWQGELLDGLLGADLIAFHIQAHSNNFLDTVERAIESQVEWEHFSVRRKGHMTQVRAFPISVEFPEPAQAQEPRKSPYVLRAELMKNLGLNARFLGIGVDRVDYTKGILERFRAIERFFEKYPAYREKFTFVQIGAPSRTHIKRYHDLLGEVEEEAERINWKLQTSSWKPIVLRNKHHSHQEIEPYYRAADVCLVTSLHDGMNLVAKEFVAARDDAEGALILSEFTGAARELQDAFVVNPYDTEQIADAIHTALEMEPRERQERMRRMRQVVRDNNVYRWAGNLIAGLSEIRIEKAEAPAGNAMHA